MVWYQNDWSLFGRRYEMIARAWVQKHPEDRVLVVEPPVNPRVWMRNFMNAFRSGDWVMVRHRLSRLKLIFQPLSRESDRLWVLQVFLIWPFRSTGYSWLTNFSFGLALRRVRAFLEREGWDRPLLWAYPPHSYVRFVADRWPKDRICADLVDDNTSYASMPEPLRREYQNSYSSVLEKSSVVFSVSDYLKEKFSTAARPVVHVPNAVPLNGFPKSEWRTPSLPAGRRACYVGRIDERLDFPLLEKTMADHPGVRFVFIGTLDWMPASAGLGKS
jgi:hypothetical protein